MKSNLSKKSQNPLCLAIHGFTGEAYDFAPLFEQSGLNLDWRFVDLPGHSRYGEIDKDNLEEWKLFVTRVDEIVHEAQLAERELVLLGYSMGSRLLLRAAIEKCWNYGKLILIGCHPGLEDGEEKSVRLKSDQQWADKLKAEGTASFVHEWMQQPIISTQKSVTDPARIASKERLAPESLGRALVYYSNGNLNAVWDRLTSIQSDVLLVAGEKDQKFRDIHERMHQQIENCECFVIPHAAHAPHLENSEGFCKFLKTVW